MIMPTVRDVEDAVLAVIWPKCACSYGACGTRIPIFRWDGDEPPTAAEIEDLAQDIAAKVWAVLDGPGP